MAQWQVREPLAEKETDGSSRVGLSRAQMLAVLAAAHAHMLVHSPESEIPPFVSQNSGEERPLQDLSGLVRPSAEVRGSQPCCLQ